MSRLMSSTTVGRRAAGRRRKNGSSAPLSLPARALRALGTVALAFLIGWGLILRFRPQPLLSRVRQFNKRILNPAMLQLAGRRFWYASSIEHVGRHSGRSYVTPVVAEPIAEGFVVPLPYGTDVDWLRNVLISGTCTIKRHGDEYRCEKPVVVAMEEVAAQLPNRLRRTWGLLGIRDALTLKVVSPNAPAH